MPVYYASKVLKNVELWYKQIEKVAHVVVISAWKLQLYFPSHKIMIYSDKSLKKVLEKPEHSGRSLPWVIELTEHSLEYQNQTIKALTLSYFIVYFSAALLTLEDTLHEEL